MEERELSIVDLLVEILLHWRIMLIWMIVCAAIFGAFSYARSGNAIEQQQAQYVGMVENPEACLTEEEIRNVAYVVDYEKKYLEKAAYLEKSPLMQMDSNGVNKAEATIAVVAEDRRTSHDIKKIYEDIVESSECVSKVAEDIGMDTIGIGELIFVDNIGMDTTGIGELIFVDKMARNTSAKNSEDTALLESNEEIDDAADVFKIVVVHSKEEICREMLADVIAFLGKKQPDMENTLGEHEFVVVNESFGIVSDMEIAKQQKAVLDDVTAMKTTFFNAKKELSEKEQNYYAILMGDTEAEAGEHEVQKTIPSAGVSIKYVLLGAIMGAFVYAFILLLIYIFNTKIRATDNFQELYGLPQLGMIPREPGKKKVLGIVDKWILAIRNHNKRQFSPEEALELAAVAAKMAAGKEGLQEICLMGCSLKEHSLEVCGKIRKRLEKENICVNILSNVLYDAQMLAELGGAKGVILAESAGSTLYSEITEELELLKRQGIKALGGILVE